jgi:predicted GIY-YIG superfamily endonuclease
MSTTILQPAEALSCSEGVEEVSGLVYLIHFEEPYAHARHYLGATFNLEQRLALHRAGKGAKLLKAVNQRGIAWEVVRTWPGGWELERALKARKNAPKLCPRCIKQALLRRLNIGTPAKAGQARGLWQA